MGDDDDRAFATQPRRGAGFDRQAFPAAVMSEPPRRPAFADRADAGRRLAVPLGRLGLDRPLLLALPRGGVPVAAAVSAVLHAPYDVLVARKIGAPGRSELGVGAIAEGGEPVLDAELLARLRLRPADVAGTVERERAELARRVTRYRGDRPLEVAGRTVVLLDDGLATGGTARAAIGVLRAAGAGPLVLAVPVGAADTVARLRSAGAQVVAVLTPDRLASVGEWYADFRQLTDDDVLRLLDRRLP